MDGKIQYEGNWANDKYDGYGVEYYQRYGTKRYEGDWKDGKRDGKGITYQIDRSKQHEGNYRNGEPEGPGISYYGHGAKWFEGNWTEIGPEGHVTEYHENGAIKYVGDLHEGKRSGQGASYDINGNLIFSGNWVDDKPAAGEAGIAEAKTADMEKARYAFRELESMWSPYLWWINVNPNNRLLPCASRMDTKTLVIRTPDGTSMHEFRNSTTAINAAMWNADGKALLIATWGGILYLWEPGNGRLLERKLSDDSVECAAWSPDNRQVAAFCEDGKVYVLNTKLEAIKTIDVQRHLCNGCFSEDGRDLYACGKGGVYIIGIENDKIKIVDIPFNGAISVCAGKNSVIATTVKGSVLKISQNNEEPLFQRNAYATVLAKSSDGKLAAGYEDGTIVFFTARNEVEGTYKFDGKVIALAWSPVSKEIFVGINGGSGGVLVI